MQIVQRGLSWPLFVLASALRKPGRAGWTALGIAFSIVAFLFQNAIVTRHYDQLRRAASDRLFVRNKQSLLFTLPMSHLAKIERMPFVSQVTHLDWFGGIYRDNRNFFPRYAVDGPSYLAMYPKLKLSAEERQAWLSDPSGCLIGNELARRYGWKPGDRFVVTGTLYPGRWEFTIRGIFESTVGPRGGDMLFHWRYLNDRISEPYKDHTLLYVVQLTDPAQAPAVSQAIDAEFEGTPGATKTQTEGVFRASMISNISMVLKALQLIAFVMNLMLMIVLANTMAMSANERTHELAVMRVLGFGPAWIFSMVVGEGLLIGLLGIALGLGLATPILGDLLGESLQAALGSLVGEFHLTLVGAAQASSVALGAVLLAVLPAASRAARVRLADALRTTN
jgi:putative ABC transport system permease protein